MKITVDSLGSSSEDDESGQVNVDEILEDSDVEMIEAEEKEVEQLINQVNWIKTAEKYTNGRGGSSYRGTRGGNRMRGSGPGSGGGGGRGNGQGYRSPPHSTNLSSASSSPEQEDQQPGLSADLRPNGDGGGDDDQDLKETLALIAANINTGFACISTAMDELRRGQLELCDAKQALERICHRHGMHPEFPASEVMVGRCQVDGPVGEGAGRGRGGVSARARKWHPRMRPSKGPKPSSKLVQGPEKLVNSSVYNSQISKEGVTKLVKRLDLKGAEKFEKHAVVVLHDIGSREKGNSGNGAVKIECDAADKMKMAEIMEEDKQEEEDEEEYRPIRKKSKENLPHWRKLRVEPPVMERIMKRLMEHNSSSTPISQSATDNTYFSAQGVGSGGGEEKIKEEQIGEEN